MTALHITVPAELSTPAVRLLLKNPTTDRRAGPVGAPFFLLKFRLRAFNDAAVDESPEGSQRTKKSEAIKKRKARTYCGLSLF